MADLDRMLPGVMLADAAALASRIRISSGTAPARFLDPAAVCHPDAIVPVGPWRAANNDELRLLAQGRAGAPMDFVAVMSLPRELTVPLLAVAGNFLISTPRPTIDASLLGVGLGNLSAHIAARFHAGSEPARPLGVAVNPSGRATVTIDPTDGLRLGLHFDSWFSGPIEGRPKAPNRVCVNLGAESRRLLFVNLPILAICDILGRSGGMGATTHPTEIGRLFLNRFPDYPVICVTVQPGEAYVAPTENIIHDGDTSDIQGTDVCFTMLGQFRNPSLQIA